MKLLRTLFDLLRQTFTEWNEDKAPRLAAALAYYTAFSLAPLLVVTIAIVGFVVSQETVQNQITDAVTQTAGADAAEFVDDMIQNANRPAEGIFATVIGLITLLLGAIGAFGQLQDALNTIWDVEEAPKPPKQTVVGSILAVVKDKVLSFGMLLVVGFLLLVSLVASTAISGLNNVVAGLGVDGETTLGVMNFFLSFLVITVLFAMLFKVLPKIHIRWRDVWLGAAFTALLFSVGKLLLGLYLSGSSTASAYGAAGSFVLILLWIYYSAQIVLFGAEFTQVFARRFGSQKTPEKIRLAAAKSGAVVTDTTRQPVYKPADPSSIPLLPARVPVNPPPAPSKLRRRLGGIAGVAVAVGTVALAIVIGFFQKRAEAGTGNVAERR
jgi:membrane protein